MLQIVNKSMFVTAVGVKRIAKDVFKNINKEGIINDILFVVNK